MALRIVNDVLITQKIAVYEAIENTMLGNNSDLSLLTKEASRIYGGSVHYNTVCRLRKQWERENLGATSNKATHLSVPRRNMLNDDRLEIKQLDALKELEKAFKTKKGAIPRIKKFIQSFHSIPQQLTAIDKLQSYRQAA